MLFSALLKRIAQQSDGKNSVNNDRHPEYPPDVAVVAEKALIKGILP